MEIKIISDDYFVDLIQLYIETYESVPVKRTAVEATKILVDSILYKKDFYAFGLFEDKKLVGFLSGFGVDETTYHFYNLYTIIKFNRKLKDLIEFGEKFIKELGYSHWEADCVIDNTCSMSEKFGAIKMSTKYRKGI